MSAPGEQRENGDRPLRLVARDKEDLAYFSALLQDAVLPAGDMAFDPRERRFMFVANRYRWESEAREVSRVLCGVGLENVTSVRRRKLSRSKSGFLAILAISLVDKQTIQILFSGGAAIRLKISSLLCHLQDLAEPWPTAWRPKHDTDKSS